MKKLIFGVMLLLTGCLSAAVLLSGAMTQYRTTVSSQTGEAMAYSAAHTLGEYGLLPALIVFGMMALIGLIFAVKGLTEKE